MTVGQPARIARATTGWGGPGEATHRWSGGENCTTADRVRDDARSSDGGGTWKILAACRHPLCPSPENGLSPRSEQHIYVEGSRYGCWRHPHLEIIFRCGCWGRPHLEMIFRCGCCRHPHLKILAPIFLKENIFFTY
jgi:hypothetical protein